MEKKPEGRNYSGEKKDTLKQKAALKKEKPFKKENALKKEYILKEEYTLREKNTLKEKHTLKGKHTLKKETAFAKDVLPKGFTQAVPFLSFSYLNNYAALPFHMPIRMPETVDEI